MGDKNLMEYLLEILDLIKHQILNKEKYVIISTTN